MVKKSESEISDLYVFLLTHICHQGAEISVVNILQNSNKRLKVKVLKKRESEVPDLYVFLLTHICHLGTGIPCQHTLDFELKIESERISRK